MNFSAVLSTVACIFFSPTRPSIENEEFIILYADEVGSLL